MNDCIVVFDTNSYRQFASKTSEEVTKKHISDLKKLEKLRNIQAVLATDVAVELYSHMEDLNDPEYDICKNSLMAQYLHTMIDDGGSALILNSDVHLCNILFSKLPDFSINEQKKVLKMSNYLYNNSTAEHLEGYIPNFKGISTFSGQKKTDFIKHLLTFQNSAKEAHMIIKDGTLEEKVRAREILKTAKEEFDGDGSIKKFAGGLLERATSTLGIDIKTLSQEEKDEKISIIREHFSVPLIFVKNIYKSILQNPHDINLKNPEKGNSYWDYELSFVIGNYIKNKAIIFVTSEKKFFIAAKEAGFGDRVITLKHYLDDMGYDSSFLHSV